MAVGVVSRYAICDIADAIRSKNGEQGTYRPSEMAAAVLALDGTATEPGAVMPRTGTPYGLLDDSVLSAIADAIRAQNGTTTRYRPSEMAEAIRALEWTPAARALLLQDGTLELTYLATAASPSGGTVSKVIDPPTEALGALGDAPWYADRESITRVAFDASFSGRDTPSLAYWLDNLNQLQAVEGLGNVTGCTSIRQAFGHNVKLETVDLTGFDMSGLADAYGAFMGDSALTTIWMSAGQAVPDGATADMAFNGCVKLVGGNGTTYSTSRLSGTYLRPDADGTPGYGKLKAS